MTRVLDITHLQLIRDILGDKNFDPTKWRDLGSKLQQTDPKLNTIAVKGNHNPSDCLRECLCQWLQSGKASPDTLVNALDSMGLDAAADGIGILKDEASWLLLLNENKLLTLSLADTTADFLLSGDFISRETRDKIKRRGNLLSDKALREACTKVAGQHSKLKELAELLKPNQVGQDLLEDYNKAFPEDSSAPVPTTHPAPIQPGATSQSLGEDQVDTDSSDKYPEYKINRKGTRHGVLLIINNVLFGGDGSKDRKQSIADAMQLAEVFGGYGYKVIADKQDLNATEITETLRSVVTKEVDPNDDSFICCILSHGNAQGIEGVKKEGDKEGKNFVTVTELADIVKECQGLRGKPKIFFFQACRGEEAPTPVNIDNLGASTSTEEAKSVVVDGRSTALPPDADFLFGFSTTEGNVAARYLDHGSPYIKALCRVMKDHPKWSIDDILLVVNGEVSQQSLIYKSSNFQQMPEIRSTLRKKFYITK